MCASAVRYAGFREYVYGTSIATLVARGWTQIRIPSAEVYARSTDLPNLGALIAGVLTNETNRCSRGSMMPSTRVRRDVRGLKGGVRRVKAVDVCCFGKI